jgi:hypothetical protein
MQPIRPTNPIIEPLRVPTAALRAEVLGDVDAFDGRCALMLAGSCRPSPLWWPHHGHQLLTTMTGDRRPDA